MKIHILDTPAALGAAAAAHAAARIDALRARHAVISILFATGASQLETLRHLTRLPGIPWNHIVGFHMDEYLGIAAHHPASFRRYLRDELVARVPLAAFHYLNGDAPDPAAIAAAYADLLAHHPPQLCLLGIGENGHLAFNDPGQADFYDPQRVKIVPLDPACRQQQVNEGWFSALEHVPSQAITLTIPALFDIPEWILSVPGPRKAEIVKRALTAPVSPECPATIARNHPNAHLYLDRASAALLPAVTAPRS